MADPNIVPHTCWCEVHEKKGFTKDNAKKAIKRMRRKGDTGMREYPCDVIPGAWHTGHLPLAVLMGLKTASEVYGPPPAA